MNWVKTLDRWRAAIVDEVSFGFVNTLHWRHPLPFDFSRQWQEYRNNWSTVSLEEYYAIPSDYSLPAWHGENKFRFESPIQSPFPKNNRAAFDIFPCDKGWEAPTMILSHGLMSVSDIGYRIWAKRLNERGWNAVFMHLPYHYSRRPPGILNGEYAVNAHLIRTVEGIRQAVMDARILIQLLSQKGCTLFGGWGTSYGGWITALLACVEPRLQRIILVEPILNVNTAIWASPASITIRAALRRAGVTAEDTRPHLRLCCPTHLKPLTQGENVILIAGEYDKIAAPEEISELHQAWPGSHFHCFPQGHVGYTLMPESFRLAQEVWKEDFQQPAQEALSSGGR